MEHKHHGKDKTVILLASHSSDPYIIRFIYLLKLYKLICCLGERRCDIGSFGGYVIVVFVFHTEIYMTRFQSH